MRKRHGGHRKTGRGSNKTAPSEKIKIRAKSGGILRVNTKGFLLCPLCGNATKTKVLPQTSLVRFPLYCPWCKRESIVNKKPEP